MKRIVFFMVILFSLNSFSQGNRVQLIEQDFGIKIPECSDLIYEFTDGDEIELIFEFDSFCFELLLEELKNANEYLIILSIDAMFYSNDFEDELSIVVEVDKTKKQLKYRRYN
jgi:hypothetical protein